MDIKKSIVTICLDNVKSMHDQRPIKRKAGKEPIRSRIRIRLEIR